MSLPDEERAGIAAELLASLDHTAVEDPAVARQPWTREIERRAHRVVAGDDDGQDRNDLRMRLTNELAGRVTPSTPAVRDRLTGDRRLSCC